MIWQDLVITLSSLVFVLALMPQIVLNYRQKSVKDISMGYLALYNVGLILLEVGLLGSGYWLSSIFNGICVLQYGIIMVQKWHYGRKYLNENKKIK
jgi:uncharacterized protein with PQ loop repeat